MHKHLFQECNKTSNCASSRIACRNKDLFSPNPVKASQLQVTTENFGSQNKKNQYRLNSKNKQVLSENKPQPFTIRSQANLEIQNAKLRINRQHISTAQSNGSIKMVRAQKDARIYRPTQIKNKIRLQNAEGPQKQFRLINRLKGLRKLKLSDQKEQREMNHLCTKENENDARSQRQRKIKKNDTNPQKQDISSINLSAKSNFAQDNPQFTSDSFHSTNSVQEPQLSQLGIQSKLQIEKKMKLSVFVERVNTVDESILSQIRRHLQIIQQIYLFVKESVYYCPDEQEWKELHFLLFKKYYLQRLKIVHFLKKYPMRNPFIISTCKISLKEVLRFMNTQQGYELIKQLQTKNKQVYKELCGMYNSFEKSKVGQKVNLFVYDNFSQWILQELWIEFTLTQYNIDLEKQILSERLCRILQIIFLIVEVNGRRLVSFESGSKAIETKTYQKYISNAKLIFQSEIQYQ